MTTATFQIWRGGAQGGEFEGLHDAGVGGHGRARRRPPDSGRAGQRPRRALELQGGQVRIVLGRGERQPAPDVHDAPERARPDRSRSRSSRCARFPPIRDLVTDVSWNFRAKKRIKTFTPRPPDAPRRHVAHAAGRRRTRAGVPEVHRVLPLPGRLPRAARPSACSTEFIGPALPGLRGGARNAPARHGGPHARDLKTAARHRLLQHHEVLHEGLSRRASRSPTTRSSR